MQRDRPQVGEEGEPLGVVAEEVVGARGDGAQPPRGEVGGALLEERLAGDAVGVAVDDERPVAQIGEDRGGDRAVVADQVPLGVPLPRPVDLVEVGQLEREGGGRRRLFVARRVVRRAGGRQALLRPLVVAQAEEDRMAQVAPLGPLLVAHLADQLGVDPHDALARHLGERPRPLRRLQAGADLGHLALGEAGAHGAGVVPPLAPAQAQVQLAEAARAGRKPEDREVGRAVDPHLQPVGRVAAPVLRIGPLGDDALEPEPLDRRVEVLAALEHLLRTADRRRLWAEHAPQQRLAVGERERPQVVAGERQEVEGEERRRRRRGRVRGVDRAGALAAPLQALEARPAAFVQDHRLAVEDQVEGERRDRAGELGEDRRRRAPATVEQARLPVPPLGEHPEAVVFELEEPSGRGERTFACLRFHYRDRRRVDICFWYVQFFYLGKDLAQRTRCIGFPLDLRGHGK